VFQVTILWSCDDVHLIVGVLHVGVCLVVNVGANIFRYSGMSSSCGIWDMLCVPCCVLSFCAIHCSVVVGTCCVFHATCSVVYVTALSPPFSCGPSRMGRASAMQPGDSTYDQYDSLCHLDSRMRSWTAKGLGERTGKVFAPLYHSPHSRMPPFLGCIEGLCYGGGLFPHSHWSSELRTVIMGKCSLYSLVLTIWHEPVSVSCRSPQHL
jgi:hypothetical protein